MFFLSFLFNNKNSTLLKTHFWQKSNITDNSRLRFRWNVRFFKTVKFLKEKTNSSKKNVFLFNWTRTEIRSESFQEFLPDDFDIKSFSATVLQTRIVSDYLQHLNELVRNLDVEIKQQVRRKNDEKTKKRILSLWKGFEQRAGSFSSSNVDRNSRRCSRKHSVENHLVEVDC